MVRWYVAPLPSSSLSSTSAFTWSRASCSTRLQASSQFTMYRNHCWMLNVLLLLGSEVNIHKQYAEAPVRRTGTESAAPVGVGAGTPSSVKCHVPASTSGFVHPPPLAVSASAPRRCPRARETLTQNPPTGSVTPKGRMSRMCQRCGQASHGHGGTLPHQVVDGVQQVLVSQAILYQVVCDSCLVAPCSPAQEWLKCPHKCALQTMGQPDKLLAHAAKATQPHSHTQRP